ncbi:hypothetical protein KKC22_04850 [Myxococcota bacterium]|nr:hypothetical protein [Myxococcota bacterium]
MFFSCSQGNKSSTCPCRSDGAAIPPGMAAGTDPAATEPKPADPGLGPDPAKPQPSPLDMAPGTPAKPPVSPVTVPSPTPGIAQYDDSDQVPATLSVMTKKIRDQFESGKLPVGFSLALSNLAGHLQVYQGKPLAPSSLLEMASEWGIASPWILQNYMVASGYDADFLANWIAKNLASYRNQHAISHFGFSVARRSDGADVVVLLMQRRRFTHSPFSRWVDPGNFVTVNGGMEKGVASLEVLVTSPDHSISRMPVKLASDGTFSVKLDFCNTTANKGHYSVELMGKDGQGPFVAGLFPVGCGKEFAKKPPTIQLQAPAKDFSLEEFEKDVMTKVNAYRTKLNLKPFADQAKLAHIARAHSIEMCGQKKIYHVSPSTGSPLDRVKRAGLSAQLVAENVAMGPSPDEVVTAWVKSEGHRLNLQHPKGTHAAIGVCKGTYGTDTVLYYVTLLIASF